MRWADVYVPDAMADVYVAGRRCCPPESLPSGAGSGVTMARAGPHPRRARSMRWADVYVSGLGPPSPAWAGPAGPMAERWLRGRRLRLRPGPANGPTSTSPAWARDAMMAERSL